ncbi:MAG: double zinc ribbon domain-containing protein [Clostridiales bacterium]|nr:double zinc ribbon domain-containing protein [Clostridiales bacterium]
MRVPPAIKEGLNYARSLIYPDRCCFCGKVIGYKDRICPRCSERLPFIGEDRCWSCGNATRECNCSEFVIHHYTAIVGTFKYMNEIRKGIVDWKFFGKTECFKFFTHALAETVRRCYGDFGIDFITFIPQHKDEIAEGKVNTSELLAREVGRILKIPVKQVLVKTFPNKKQHTLPWYRKSGNVAGVYKCIHEDEVKGKVVLLIDDVKTSGSTLNECTKMLLIGRADFVYCAVLAVNGYYVNPE